MSYADGFVIPIQPDRIPEYQRISRKAGKIWKDHGALQYIECVGDDLDAMHGTPFPKAFRTRPGETVIFSWILYKSRAHRDRVNANVMKDPRMAEFMKGNFEMPFDTKRMVYGGFKSIVNL